MGIRKDKAHLLGLYGMMLAMGAQTSYIEKTDDTPLMKKEVEPPIPNGMKYYCFRKDGTFLQYERDGAMLKDEKFFTCYALNDKNAIKKFNSYVKNNSSETGA
jgi:hypothetical protein